MSCDGFGTKRETPLYMLHDNTTSLLHKATKEHSCQIIISRIFLSTMTSPRLDLFTRMHRSHASFPTPFCILPRTLYKFTCLRTR